MDRRFALFVVIIVVLVVGEKEMILCRLICKYLCCIYCIIIPPVNIPKARDEKKGEY